MSLFYLHRSLQSSNISNKMKLFTIITLTSFYFIRTVWCDLQVTDQVYLEIEHDGKYMGRIVIGLFGTTAPKTVLNFKTIATNGIDGRTYEGSTFHRVIQRFMIQGGDIMKADGTSSVSIYGDLFEDEDLTISHSGAGFVSMANSGPDTNGCQFFITTMACKWLDGHHVVFGKVIRGQDIVHRIEHVRTDTDDIPVQPVKIIQCGLIETLRPFYISEDPYDYSLLQWIYDGILPLSFSFCILGFFQWVLSKLNGFKLV